ncbi:hypothetical protein [Nocardia stercoris]|uniref:Ig-like domain repeat protein n=1 Tax=Nocardia stercoris TaxID=2483361 RepID=A0A3M2L6Q6_9NOCA|nr:hypothetical protein [Nocardia stercoris]RMI33207.1 hypothetical protein EBN03_08385 [Nocardia stercoris]
MSNAAYRLAPVAVLAAVTAGSAVAAPQATAHTITAVTVTPGLGGGFGTGCTYQVSATVDADAYRITFLDNDYPIRGNQNLQVSGNTASLAWTPSTTGTHVITALFTVADQAPVSTTVQVDSTGLNLGSACFAQ